MVATALPTASPETFGSELSSGGTGGTGEPLVLTMTAAEAAGQPMLIPGGAWFLRAEFVRDGADLVLTGPEGQNIIIKGYFEASEPPALTTENGVTLKADAVIGLAGPLAPGQYADTAENSIDGLDSLAQIGEPIGTIETLSGTVEVTRADGSREVLNPGDPLYQGDFVETAADGSIGVVFLDESTFSLGQNGRITFDEMVYSPEAQTGAAAMTLLQGTFSFVSGAIAKTDPDAMVIDTPTATIGIRGTGGGGTAGADGSLSIAILEETGGITGEIVVANDQGSTIINQPNTGVTVTPGAAPTLPVAYTAQQLGQEFGSTLLSLPNAAEAFTSETLSEIRSGIPDSAETVEATGQQAAPAFVTVKPPVFVVGDDDDEQVPDLVAQAPEPEAVPDTSGDSAADLAAAEAARIAALAAEAQAAAVAQAGNLARTVAETARAAADAADDFAAATLRTATESGNHADVFPKVAEAAEAARLARVAATEAENQYQASLEATSVTAADAALDLARAQISVAEARRDEAEDYAQAATAANRAADLAAEGLARTAAEAAREAADEARDAANDAARTARDSGNHADVLVKSALADIAANAAETEATTAEDRLQDALDATSATDSEGFAAAAEDARATAVSQQGLAEGHAATASSEANDVADGRAQTAATAARAAANLADSSADDAEATAVASGNHADVAAEATAARAAATAADAAADIAEAQLLAANNTASATASETAAGLAEAQVAPAETQRDVAADRAADATADNAAANTAADGRAQTAATDARAAANLADASADDAEATAVASGNHADVAAEATAARAAATAADAAADIAEAQLLVANNTASAGASETAAGLAEAQVAPAETQRDVAADRAADATADNTAANTLADTRAQTAVNEAQTAFNAAQTAAANARAMVAPSGNNVAVEEAAEAAEVAAGLAQTALATAQTRLTAANNDASAGGSVEDAVAAETARDTAVTQQGLAEGHETAANTAANTVADGRAQTAVNEAQTAFNAAQTAASNARAMVAPSGNNAAVEEAAAAAEVAVGLAQTALATAQTRLTDANNDASAGGSVTAANLAETARATAVTQQGVAEGHAATANTAANTLADTRAQTAVNEAQTAFNAAQTAASNARAMVAPSGNNAAVEEAAAAAEAAVGLAQTALATAQTRLTDANNDASAGGSVTAANLAETARATAVTQQGLAEGHAAIAAALVRAHAAVAAAEATAEAAGSYGWSYDADGRELGPLAADATVARNAAEAVSAAADEAARLSNATDEGTTAGEFQTVAAGVEVQRDLATDYAAIAAALAEAQAAVAAAYTASDAAEAAYRDVWSNYSALDAHPQANLEYQELYNAKTMADTVAEEARAQWLEARAAYEGRDVHAAETAARAAEAAARDVLIHRDSALDINADGRAELAATAARVAATAAANLAVGSVNQAITEAAAEANLAAERAEDQLELARNAESAKYLTNSNGYLLPPDQQPATQNAGPNAEAARVSDDARIAAEAARDEAQQKLAEVQELAVASVDDAPVSDVAPPVEPADDLESAEGTQATGEAGTTGPQGVVLTVNGSVVDAAMGTVEGTAGDDIFDLSGSGGLEGDNSLVLEGGAGADTFTFNLDNVADLDEGVTFRYDTVLDGGDTITGLTPDVVFHMEFDPNNFHEVTDTNFQAGGSVTEEGLEQPVQWFYNTETATLQYDEDGFNNGNEAVTIATFKDSEGNAHNVDLTAEQLTFINEDPTPSTPDTDTGMG